MGSPHQVVARTFALLQDLQMVSVAGAEVNDNRTDKSNQSRVQGTTVPTDFVFSGPKIYSDATCKKKKNTTSATAGIGVYFTVKSQDYRTDVFITAK
jgi:hypothetical protein